jgi:hypothetical protein
MSAIPASAKIQKLIMQLIIKAAKGDREAVFQIAQKIVELFERGLEEEEKSAS